jgi:hypothetical protein
MTVTNTRAKQMAKKRRGRTNGVRIALEWTGNADNRMYSSADMVKQRWSHWAKPIDTINCSVLPKKEKMKASSTFARERKTLIL